jgi:hypothetical protein
MASTTTITGTYSTGVILSPYNDTVESTGFIDAPGSPFGIYLPTSGGSSQFYNDGRIISGPATIAGGAPTATYGYGILSTGFRYITNNGTVEALGAVQAIGIAISGDNGEVDNLANGLIYGQSYGIGIEGTTGEGGRVTNAGHIEAGMYGTGIFIAGSGGGDSAINGLGGVVAAGEVGIAELVPTTVAAFMTNLGTVDGSLGVGGYINAVSSVYAYNGSFAALQGAISGLVVDSQNIVSLNNYGDITNSGVAGLAGISLAKAGADIAAKVADILNGPAAFIDGTETGLILQGLGTAGLTVDLQNQGTIEGDDTALSLQGTGAVFNSITGVIDATSATATAAISIDQTAGSAFILVNAGTIMTNGADGEGIILNGGSLHFSQTSTGRLQGGIEVTNAAAYIGVSGTVTGGIQLAADEQNTLALSQGFSIDGSIALGTGSFSTLMLGSSSSASTVDINAQAGGLSLSVYPGDINFFDYLATWTLVGNVSNLTEGVSIVNFSSLDTIELQDVTPADPGGYIVTQASFLDNVLTLTESSGETYTIDIEKRFSHGGFVIQTTSLTPTAADPATQASLIELVPCFAAGTRILTPRGERLVEHLAPGDIVITVTGEDAPLIWVGRRHLSLRRHPAPQRVRPIRIRAGALGDNSPARDLYLSPDHALFLGGALIPAKHLVNHRNIEQVDVAEITYFHLELPAHAIIFADSAPVESYLDCGARGVFETAGPLVELHPDFADTIRRAGSCAPVRESGPALAAARAQIAARTAYADAGPGAFANAGPSSARRLTA